MNIPLIKKELKQMPAIIKKDALNWQQNVVIGCEQVKLNVQLYMKIFECETILFSEQSTPRAKRAVTQRLDKLFDNLEKASRLIYKTLAELTDIKLRTERMWRRVALWNQDECINKYCIVFEVTTPKLLEYLEFLTRRYDYEWEVKEMVVLELGHLNSSYDCGIMLEAWRDNRHAGGDEFNRKLFAFRRLSGQRPRILPRHLRAYSLAF